jgi:hypothetical protein
VAAQRRIRWYNPKLGDFEWRHEPQSDEMALADLDGCQGADDLAAAYREWRELGASITVALIRAGEVAREKGEGLTPGSVPASGRR